MPAYAPRGVVRCGSYVNLVSRHSFEDFKDWIKLRMRKADRAVQKPMDRPRLHERASEPCEPLTFHFINDESGLVGLVYSYGRILQYV